MCCGGFTHGYECFLQAATTLRVDEALSRKEERMEASLPLARKLFTRVGSLHYMWGSPGGRGSLCRSHCAEMGILEYRSIKEGPRETQVHNELHNEGSRNLSP